MKWLLSHQLTFPGIYPKIGSNRYCLKLPFVISVIQVQFLIMDWFIRNGNTTWSVHGGSTTYSSFIRSLNFPDNVPIANCNVRTQFCYFVFAFNNGEDLLMYLLYVMLQSYHRLTMDRYLQLRSARIWAVAVVVSMGASVCCVNGGVSTIYATLIQIHYSANVVVV